MKLKLGPLPNTETAKLALTLSVPLKTQLDRYAELYSAQHGCKTEAQPLIPLMLEQFLARDRAFQRALKGAKT